MLVINGTRWAHNFAFQYCDQGNFLSWCLIPKTDWETKPSVCTWVTSPLTPTQIFSLALPLKLCCLAHRAGWFLQHKTTYKRNSVEKLLMACEILHRQQPLCLQSSLLPQVSSSKQLSPRRGRLMLSEISESLCNLIWWYAACFPASWAQNPTKRPSQVDKSIWGLGDQKSRRSSLPKEVEGERRGSLVSQCLLPAGLHPT